METVIEANKAQVTIIDKRSSAERKSLLEKAVKDFYKDLERTKKHGTKHSNSIIS